MASPSPASAAPSSSENVPLFADKHVQFVAGFAKDRTTFEAVATDHLRLSGVYWGLATLALLGKLDEGGPGLDREEVAAFVRSCAREGAEGVVSSSKGKVDGGDGGGGGNSVGYGGAERHDAHLLYTLSAVQVAALICRMDLIDADAVMRYVSSLQLPDGSFAGDKWGEVDTRFSFCALATAALLGKLDELDVEGAARHVALRCSNFDAGFGAQPGGESHAGQVFVCVAALAIAGRLDLLGGGGGGSGEGSRSSGGDGGEEEQGGDASAGEKKKKKRNNRTARPINPSGRDALSWWLSERQTPGGGLNGRPEKLPDVCYSWWCVSSLAVLGRTNWIDRAALARFVLAAQDPHSGGIADRPEDAADVYHTFFGVAGLSLLRDSMEEEEEMEEEEGEGGEGGEGGGGASKGRRAASGEEEATATTTKKKGPSRLDSALGFDAGLAQVASIDPVFALPYEALARTAVGKEGWRGLFGGG